MRMGIATGGYHKPGETFVNLHVEQLFGGDTVVIANKLALPHQNCSPR